MSIHGAMTGRRKVVLIAICKCGAHFYANDMDWECMLVHITEDSSSRHEWVHVPDVTIRMYPK